MGLKQIREFRGVPAKRGGRVRYTGGDKPVLGTIKSASDGYLMILLDGDEHTKPFHPTWKLEYLERDCQINEIWSGVCKLGTKSCDVNHKEPHT